MFTKTALTAALILGTVSVALATEHDANLANRYPGISASAAQFQGRNVSLNAGQTIVMDRAGGSVDGGASR